MKELNGGMSDPSETSKRSNPKTSKRSTNIPLSLGEIQQIMDACGIVKKDKGPSMERTDHVSDETRGLEAATGGR